MTSLPTSSAAPRERLLYLDILRCISILAVIVGHVLIPLYLSADHSEILIGTAYLSLCIPCIPVLLLISGALLLASPKPIDIAVFYLKRLPKLIIPLLGWSLIYYSFNIHMENGVLPTLATFVERFFSSTLSGPLWFLYMMIGVYLMLPFLRPTFAGDTRKLSFACSAVIFGTYALDFIMRLVFAQPLNQIFIGTVFSFYIGYVILGNALIRMRLKIPGGRFTLAAVFLLSAAIVTYGEFLAKTGSFKIGIFFPAQSPLTFLLGVSAFLFFRDWNPTLSPNWARFIQGLSSLSYGVFLSHLLVLKLLDGSTPLFFRPGHGLDCHTISPLVGPLLVAVIVFTIASLLVAVIRRIPILRLLVP